MGPLTCQVDTMTWRHLCSLVGMMRLNSSSAIAAKFLIPAAKEKESEQTRMHALNFVADLSFQQGNLPVSTPQNSTNRVISAVTLTLSHSALLNCCGVVVHFGGNLCSNCPQIGLCERWVAVPISFWSRLQWIRGIEEEITKISLISLGVKDWWGVMSSIGYIGCIRLLNLKKQESRFSIIRENPRKLLLSGLMWWLFFCLLWTYCLD